MGSDQPRFELLRPNLGPLRLRVRRASGARPTPQTGAPASRERARLGAAAAPDRNDTTFGTMLSMRTLLVEGRLGVSAIRAHQQGSHETGPTSAGAVVHDLRRFKTRSWSRLGLQRHLLPRRSRGFQSRPGSALDHRREARGTDSRLDPSLVGSIPTRLWTSAPSHFGAFFGPAPLGRQHAGRIGPEGVGHTLRWGVSGGMCKPSHRNSRSNYKRLVRHGDGHAAARVGSCASRVPAKRTRGDTRDVRKCTR